jgi:hypothetical protein
VTNVVVATVVVNVVSCRVVGFVVVVRRIENNGIISANKLCIVVVVFEISLLVIVVLLETIEMPAIDNAGPVVELDAVVDALGVPDVVEAFPANSKSPVQVVSLTGMQPTSPASQAEMEMLYFAVHPFPSATDQSEAESGHAGILPGEVAKAYPRLFL